LQYDSDMSHYAAAAAMDGHGSSLYDPHGRHSMPDATAALSHPSMHV
jgi:hypothetical protein